MIAAPRGDHDDRSTASAARMGGTAALSVCHGRLRLTSDPVLTGQLVHVEQPRPREKIPALATTMLESNEAGTRRPRGGEGGQVQNVGLGQDARRPRALVRATGIVQSAG